MPFPRQILLLPNLDPMLLDKRSQRFFPAKKLEKNPFLKIFMTQLDAKVYAIFIIANL